MKKLSLKIFISFLFYSSLAIAKTQNTENFIKNKAMVNKENRCKTTPRFRDDFEPKEFNKSNNLTRNEGDVSVIIKEKIILEGEVVDQFCAPIPDAYIYIWHPDEEGKYNYSMLKHKNNSKQKLSTFLGSGTANSSRNGKFKFITITPGSLKNVGPFFNIRVEHPSYGNLQTRFYLKDLEMYESKDSCQEVIKIMKAQNECGPQEMPVKGVKHYKFRVVMHVDNNVKHY